MSHPVAIQKELEEKVMVSTGGRIRDLAVELSPEQIVLRGRAATYHVKQLAQHGILAFMPHIRLENAILVDNRN